MSTTAIGWVLCFGVLVLMSFRRPIWAFALYVQTFFMAPQLWWWGKALPQTRYALYAGIIFLIAIIIDTAQGDESEANERTPAHTYGLLMIINATFVHIVLAVNRTISMDTYVELLKYTLLFHLIWKSVKDRRDFGIALVAIALGGFYIGYEVTINHRGNFNGSRLEGVGAPGADASNSLANMLLMILPLASSLLVYASGKGARKYQLLAACSAPLILNVILQCNSRGAFLGLISAGGAFLLFARGKTRKKALGAIAIGSVALFMLLGDPKILDRFSTTFVGSEERDASAESRLDFWHAAVLQLADYPLGAGGGSFKFNLGRKYQQQIIGDDATDRSIHDGYLTEATDWGVQGLLLKLLFIGSAFFATFRTMEKSRKEERLNDAIIGLCLISSFVGYTLCTVFGSYLANEWCYWLIALMWRYSQLYAKPAVVAGTVAETPSQAWRGTPEAA